MVAAETLELTFTTWSDETGDREDPEFYQPEYLCLENSLKQQQALRLDEVVDFRQHDGGIIEHDSNRHPLEHDHFRGCPQDRYLRDERGRLLANQHLQYISCGGRQLHHQRDVQADGHRHSHGYARLNGDHDDG